MNKLFESVDNLFSSDSNLTLDVEKERKDRVAKLRESVKLRKLEESNLEEATIDQEDLDDLISIYRDRVEKNPRDEKANAFLKKYDPDYKERTLFALVDPLRFPEPSNEDEARLYAAGEDLIYCGNFDSESSVESTSSNGISIAFDIYDPVDDREKLLADWVKEAKDIAKKYNVDISYKTVDFGFDDETPILAVSAKLGNGNVLEESENKKSLKEHSFDTDSDPVDVLKAIHEQYMDLGMNDEFYSDVLNRSDLGIEDLISWFEMGESDKSTKPEKKDVLKESSEMCVAMECSRTGYGPDQVVGDSMTVNELIDVLNGFDGDMKIVTSHDGGYTYGPISYGDFEEINVSDDEESEDGDYNESEKVSHRVKENEETRLFNKVARICESRKATNNVVKESNANILKRAGKKPVNKKSL